MILAVIPARGGSKGLPRKNLCLLGGLPLVSHAIRAAKKSRHVDELVVSTDDAVIAEVAAAEGAKVPFLRPAELATNETPTWPVVRHAVEQWEAASGRSVDAVVVLQPTSPLRTEDDIDHCVVKFRDTAADMCVTVVAAHDSPYFNMVEVTPESAPFARACSRLMLKHSRRQDAPPVYALNGAVYVIRASILPTLENQFRLARFAIHEMPRNRSIDIDSADDLEYAEWLVLRSSLRTPI